MVQAQAQGVDQLKAQLKAQGFVENLIMVSGAQYSVWTKGCGNPADSATLSEFMLENARDRNALHIFAMDSDTGKIGVTREGFAEVGTPKIRTLAAKYGENAANLEAVSNVGRSIGEQFADAGRTVLAAIGLPVPSERTRREQEKKASGRRGRTTLVAETAMGEEAIAESAAVSVETPQAEAPKAEERKAPGREETATIPQSDLRGNAYEFRISYDPSKLEAGYTEADLHSIKFFEKPENRDAVINFSYRNLSMGREWNDELGGKLLHRVYSRLFERVDFALVNPANGEVQQNFTVYIDREKAEQLGVNTADPLALINAGVILRVMQGAIGNETRWRRGGTEDVIAAWAEFIKSHEESGSEMRARSA